jgi:hypothetical protein
LFRRNAEYPARPLLYDELRDIVQRGWELDGAVKAALGRDTVDETQLEELNQKVCSYSFAGSGSLRGREIWYCVLTPYMLCYYERYCWHYCLTSAFSVLAFRSVSWA